MKRGRWALLAALGAVGFYAFSGTSGSPVREAVDASGMATESASAVARTSAAPKAEAKSMTLPDPDAYAREAHADPHHAPAVLHSFAAQMADRMTAALQSEQAAARLFPELKQCAEGEREIESVRATCAVNAGRLAEKYAALFGMQYLKLRAGLPQEVALSVEASGF